MVCKEDVVLWFKELESYRRIDTMCTLLNMCLPFELRFLGTCLEELGRRDSQELRAIELRVNNPLELAPDISACQMGEPTDLKIRRKMALYLALFRACNQTCVHEMYRTLDMWGDRSFEDFEDGDSLQELLLVYTMAANHPVFSFEQRMKCGEIYNKIKECKLPTECSTPPPIPHHPMQPQQSAEQQALSTNFHSQQINQLVVGDESSPPPPPLNSNHLHHQQQPLHMQQQQQNQHLSSPQQHLTMASTVMGQPPLPYSPQPMTQVISHEPGLETLTQMIHPNIGLTQEFVQPAMTWTRPNYMHATFGQQSLEGMIITGPPTASPMLSQTSSPNHSRTASPTRSMNQSQQPIQQNQPQTRNSQQRIMPMMPARVTRRPSTEITPPPQQQQLLGLDGVQTQNSKLYDEVVDGALIQLQTIHRNGYTRPIHHTIPRQSNKTYSHQYHHLQQQQQQQQLQQQQHHNHMHSNQNQFSNPNTLGYSMQNMNIIDVNNIVVDNNLLMGRQPKSTGSDSGSSIESATDISPPGTPAPLSSSGSSSARLHDSSGGTSGTNNNKQIIRHNGRSDRSAPMQPSYMYMTTIGSGGGGGGGGGTTQFPTEVFVATPTHGSNNNNSNLVTTGVLIATPTVASGKMISSPSGGNSAGNAASGTPILIQSYPPQQMQTIGQPQFTTAYPYPTQQHIQTVNTRPLMTHNTSIPPPPSTYRHPPFHIQPNGEILYPYPPSGTAIAFLPQQTSVVTSATSLVRSSPLSMQSPPPPSLASQTTPVIVQPNISYPTIITTSNAANTNGGSSNNSSSSSSSSSGGSTNHKLIVSCFNCGSQSHSGRDCQEASMEDVTRNSIYKLDYSLIGDTVMVTGPSIAANLSSTSISTIGTSLSTIPSISGIGLSTVDSLNTDSSQTIVQSPTTSKSSTVSILGTGTNLIGSK